MSAYQQQYARILELAEQQNKDKTAFAREILDQLNERIPTLFFTHPQQLHASLLISAAIVIEGKLEPPPSFSAYLFLYHQQKTTRKLPPLNTQELFRTFSSCREADVLTPLPYENFPNSDSLDPHLICHYWEWKARFLQRTKGQQISPTKLPTCFQYAANAYFTSFLNTTHNQPEHITTVIALLSFTTLGTPEIQNKLRARLEEAALTTKQNSLKQRQVTG